MVSDERPRILDPEQHPAALKALTHPLRIRLLGLLRQDGPATASELAVRTGESSASTSYHLRVLAKHDFVAEAEHRDGRERRWRSVHAVTAWNNTAMAASPGSRALVGVSRRAQVDHLERSLARHERDMADGRLDAAWLECSGISDLILRLTPESLTELTACLRRKAGELAARDADDPRARQTVLVGAALPFAPLEPSAPATDAGPDADPDSARLGPEGGKLDPDNATGADEDAL
ncbi:ArsR/SmtB family transcription factor [Streptomyces sp. NPDC001922]|uniref:ArsR/SmtB family transcription factor n=1 Tax=Streptomyces sp. NPDC001922 TaxID=3364624 RepID=UPI00368D0242